MCDILKALMCDMCMLLVLERLALMPECACAVCACLLCSDGLSCLSVGLRCWLAFNRLVSGCIVPWRGCGTCWREKPLCEVGSSSSYVLDARLFEFLGDPCG